MAWVTERERELIRLVGPVLTNRLDELARDWLRLWRESNPESPGPPDVPAVTRAAVADGVDRAIELQRRMADEVVARGVSLEAVVTAVLLWDERVLRCLARDAVEDIFTGAGAFARLHHILVVMVAEGYQRTLRAQRDEVHASLEAADRMKVELISMISHDLKTPLTTIQGCARSLEVEDVDYAQRRRFAEMILQNAERLSRLISQIVDVSRIEAGAMDLNLGPVDVCALARRLVEGILPAAPVQLQLPLEAPPVRGDADAVERILVNLIDNAVRYSPPGMPVSVEITPTNGWVELRVRDRGAGIPEERRPGLFTKFYQVDSSPTARRGGSGLGLAIVRGLAESMGGQVGYVPREPAGSEFWVRLPIA